MASCYLGIDLGGTNVKAGIVDDTGKLLGHASVPSSPDGKSLAEKDVVNQMVAASLQAAKVAGTSIKKLKAAGILSPGQASLAKGVIFRAANFPEWKNVKLRAAVSKKLHIPAVLENDAKAAAFGEFWSGVGHERHYDNFFMMTFGTGIGGGFIYQGRLVHGAFDFASEVGHSIYIPGGNLCGCGQHGCFETYASAHYVGKNATAAFQISKDAQKKSSLAGVFKTNNELTARDVGDHAEKGDAFAVEQWNLTTRAIATLCINICRTVDPQIIVLGGGMAGSGKFLSDSVQRHLEELWWKMTKPTAKIVIAKLGNDAGVIGAAGVAKDALRRRTLPGIGK